jgi:hypothetical protein
MLQQITPTLDNFLQLFLSANDQYAALIENPPQNELDIIDWRVNHIPLYEFVFPDEFQQNGEVLLFKEYYHKSADYFYETMETNEQNDLTERVHLSLATLPEINLLHSFLTAVSPTDITNINLNIINESLLDKQYQSFYICSAEKQINVNELDAPAVSVFLNSDGEVFSEKTNSSDIIGQLIINSEKKLEFIKEMNKPGVRVEVERVKWDKISTLIMGL